MPDPRPDADENEYGAQADADSVERASGGRQGEADKPADGHDRAEAAERASGAARD